jgi:hypothetical protein
MRTTNEDNNNNLNENKTLKIKNFGSNNKIHIENGSLLKTNAESIVNSTSPNLDLDCGTLSKLILNEAGLSILNECKIIYPNGIKPSEVAVTSAGYLSKFKNIFHVTFTQLQDVDSCGQVSLFFNILIFSIFLNLIDS